MSYPRPTASNSPLPATQTALLLAAIVLVPSLPLGAQEAESSGGCTLVMTPTGRTESISLRVSSEEDAYVTHVWGGMRWTCGTATMTADSAVRFDLDRRVEMFGNVRYRDTIRTLESHRLDFYEDDDRMIATGDVVLTRIASSSTLRGPHVPFLRAVSGVAERTTATGRPHMLLLPEPGQEGKPVDVDAERVDMFGERVAWAWGDVIIERPDVYAEADSSFFDMDEGTGSLYGSALARQEDLELEGDSIRLRFSEDVLDVVHAIGSGRAVGEQFRIRSDEIKAHLADNELDEVWAYGSGRSLAASSPYVLASDSLRVAATAGRLDSIIAVGLSSAVEVDSIDLAAGEPARTTGGGNWIIGDTLVIVFEQNGMPAEGSDAQLGPPTEAPRASPEPADSAEQRIERLLARGDARSLYRVVGDAAAPSRNYLIGKRIEIQFEEGRAHRVNAERAIGVYLEPGQPGDVGFPGVGGETAQPEPAETQPSETPATEPPEGGDAEPPEDPDAEPPEDPDAEPPNRGER